MNALKILESLKAGNQRFIDGDSKIQALASPKRREAVAERQKPVAVILGCSDSRVPAEIVFDQGLGDLFVIRVAGNIVAPSQIGSIEFAIEQFGVELVVVLGHSNCGAVEVTIKDLLELGENNSEYLEGIVSRIRPALKPLIEGHVKDGHVKDDGSLKSRAVKANISASVKQLERGSQILARAGRQGKVDDRWGRVLAGYWFGVFSGLINVLGATTVFVRNQCTSAHAVLQTGVLQRSGNRTWYNHHMFQNRCALVQV